MRDITLRSDVTLYDADKKPVNLKNVFLVYILSLLSSEALFSGASCFACWYSWRESVL